MLDSKIEGSIMGGMTRALGGVGSRLDLDRFSLFVVICTLLECNSTHCVNKMESYQWDFQLGRRNCHSILLVEERFDLSLVERHQRI